VRGNRGPGLAQHAEAEAVVEAEGLRVPGLEFLPELPGAEILHARADVVEQHHAAGTHLRVPVREVLAHGLVGVQPVDVQQVDAVGLEVRQRVVEQHAHQVGEAAIVLARVVLHVAEDRVVVLVGVRVAFPGVDGVAQALDVVLEHRLAEREERQPVVGAELDQHLRAQRLDDVVAERQVVDPGAEHHAPRLEAAQRGRKIHSHVPESSMTRWGSVGLK